MFGILTISMKIIIEVGYTNIKILIDEKISLYKASILNIERLMEKYAVNDNKVYICNNNIELEPTVQECKLKYIDNVIVVDKYFIFNQLQLGTKININEIGVDLLVLCLHLRLKRVKDGIIISVGSGIATIVWKDFDLYSVSINLGIDAMQKTINKKLRLTSTTDFSEARGLTTKKALELGNFIYLDGIIKSTRALFNLNETSCILTGNAITGNVWGPLKLHNENIEYENNLVLKTLAGLFIN